MSAYVVPDGYHAGFPMVEVSSELIRDYGEPKVSYEGLEEFYAKQVGIQPSKVNLKT